MGDTSRGVYRKFKIRRTDGEHKKGKKHEECSYFVLDLDCDEFAIAALTAYAKACKKKFPLLAKDIAVIIATRPCGCRSVGECNHYGPQTPGQMLGEMVAKAPKGRGR